MSQCLFSFEVRLLETAARLRCARGKTPSLALCAMLFAATRTMAADPTVMFDPFEFKASASVRANSTLPPWWPTGSVSAPARLDAGPPAADWGASDFGPTDIRSSAVPTLQELRIFSSTDFRPRKPTLFDPEPLPAGDVPMLHGTTVWQRMSDYKSRDRVRLLTLWETHGSTVSIQAGKHGDPSLQWSSRSMNRGGSTRGLFDELVSASLFSTGGGSRGSGRPVATQPVSRPAGVASVAVASVGIK